MVNLPMPVTLAINAAALYAAYVMGKLALPPMDKNSRKTWEARKTYLYIAIGVSLGLVAMAGMGGGMGGGYGGGGGYY